MTEQATEILSLHFRERCAGESATNQAYLALWIEYQRGALSADEFLRGLEHDLLRNLDELDAEWKAVKW